MDFFIADFFDALVCGHYLWQCKYCGRYFLMTTGHRQLYCQTPPPGEKFPCYKLAKNRRTATAETKANKQATTDNPYHILWKKCDAAIRKRKSRGSITADECAAAQAYVKDCYADESGINKAEGALHYKIVAELSEIRYTDSVGVVRTSIPRGCEEKKNIFYYKYFPRCEKQGGLINVDASSKDMLGYELSNLPRAIQ